MTNNENELMRDRAGKVDSNDKLVAFLYDLMRDYLPVGEVEKIIRENNVKDITSYQFTNGHLANIAKDMAERLK